MLSTGATSRDQGVKVGLAAALFATSTRHTSVSNCFPMAAARCAMDIADGSFRRPKL